MPADSSSVVPAPRLLRMSEVLSRTSLSRSNIYRRLASGDFPKPLDLGPRCPRWLESDINAWIDGHRVVQG